MHEGILGSVPTTDYETGTGMALANLAAFHAGELTRVTMIIATLPAVGRA
jgi:hypothetical protein